MELSSLAHEWTRILAPRTGDVRSELVHEAAEFLGIPVADAWQRLSGAGDRFREEWLRTVAAADRLDPATLTRFYNQSDTELFELTEWHASDQIHYRTLIVRDFAARRLGRSFLDYGSGIGNDALVLAAAGFEITLADISECLLAFATWRCRRRGFAVRTIDLRREQLPPDAFDLVLCLDVLEHIPRPLDVVRSIHASLRDSGILVVHAPFGDDPVHPMHVVHRDVVTPRMRSLGFRTVNCRFPSFICAPQSYEKRAVPAVKRAGYYVNDIWLNRARARLAALYRRTFRRPAPTPSRDGRAVASSLPPPHQQAAK
jgi:SAM-dependent methyltransferase